MRNLACVSLLLPILLTCGGTLHQVHAKEPSTDRKVFEWCLSHFSREEGESVQLLPRPPGELRSFDISNSAAPADLVKKTQIVGRLPQPIGRYQGRWTWPSIDRHSPGAIFVERLTPTEMTIVLIRRNDISENGPPERLTLSWTGTHFSYSKGTPEESRQMEILISQSGEVMFAMSGSTRTITFIEKDGRESSHTASEGWPFCFLSEKYYRAP